MGDDFDTFIKNLQKAKEGAGAESPTRGELGAVLLTEAQADTVQEILNAIQDLPGVFDRIEAYLIGRGFEDARDDIEALRKAVF